MNINTEKYYKLRKQNKPLSKLAKSIKKRYKNLIIRLGNM